MSGPQVRHGTSARVYNEHLKNVKNVVCKVNNKAPRLPIKAYVKEANFYADLYRLGHVEKQNRSLLKDINVVYRTKGKTDCQFEKYNRKKTMYLKEKEALDKIRRKNEVFLSKLDLKFVKSSYNQKDSLKDWTKALKVMKYSAKYPEFYDKKHSRLHSWSICPPSVISNPSNRQVCFLDLKIGELPKLFRVEIEVYTDIVPGTAANFVALCEGKGSAGSGPDLSYRGSVFHRIVPGLLCLGGDVLNHSGTGGMSIYGPAFPDENFILQHNGPGVVSMYTTEPDKNNSQFLITFKNLSSLNGKYVVFGRIKSSLKTLELIESCGTKSGKPLQKVTIESCGVYS